jgi:hypothetical protein
LRKSYLINSGTVFLATLIVVPTVVLIVYLTGLDNHRSFYLNSLLSTTILSVVFLAFMATGLYRGWKLKDTLGDFRKKINLGKASEFHIIEVDPVDLSDAGEAGPIGILFSFLLWLVVGLFGSFLLWLAGGVIWAVLLLLAGLLYWIIFRALRLVFKNAPRCKGNFSRSLAIALFYTVLYNSWIYLIVVGTHIWGR